VVVHAPAGITVGSGKFGIQARAAGGPVQAGMPYVVGEHRPELFVPSTSGTVVPRVPTPSRGGGSWAGGNTYNINLTVPVGAHPADVGKATVEAIRAYEDRSGKGWRL
jgi:phage-related minor tail protein